MRQTAVTCLLGGWLGVGCLVATWLASPAIAAPTPHTTGPRVSDIRIESRDHRQKGRLYEVDDYLTIISARIEPAEAVR